MNVFLRNARARNGHVEATLNHPFPAQVAAVLGAATLAGVAQLLAAVASCYHIRAVGSRHSFLLGGAGAAAFFLALAVYRLASSDSASTALLVLFILCRGAIQWPGIAIYALPNTFAPPHVRARAHGLAAAVGKVGAVVGSASYPLLLSSTGLAPLFLISCAVSGLSCLGAVLVPRPQPRATKLEHEPLIAPQTAADVDKSAEG